MKRERCHSVIVHLVVLEQLVCPDVPDLRQNQKEAGLHTSIGGKMGFLEEKNPPDSFSFLRASIGPCRFRSSPP
jgi:hypothetical protein